MLETIGEIEEFLTDKSNSDLLNLNQTEDDSFDTNAGLKIQVVKTEEILKENEE